MDRLATLTVYAYFAILLALSIYGAHRYFLLYLFHRHHRRAPRPEPPRVARRDLPTVTIQLPLYNELYVARRVIEAAAAIRYPREKLRIQVLDDSTDGTTRVAREAVEDLRRRGFDAEYRHRDVRTGFKAGALAEGLAATDSELVAIFDADFVPPPDFLEKTVPWFAEPDVGMVQTRWGYLNRDYSLLTRVQALLLDGHFVLEHTARSRSGRFFNFNGTGGVFRRRAILDAGGWEGDTLTEDLDLSYRTQLRGWRFVFLPDVECPSELPVDIYGFKNQQHRWTKGSIQVGRKLLGRIWRSDAPLKVKLEATFHLSANLSYLLLVLLSVLMPLSVMLRTRHGIHASMALEAVVFGLTTLSILTFYGVAQHEVSPNAWKCRLRDVPFIFALGIGMCINNAWAVTEALLRFETPFVRTAKYRIESMRDRWKGKLYRSARKPSFYIEGALTAYTLLAAVAVVATGNWAAIPYVALFVAGYAYVFGLSVVHGRQ